jgi:Tfp pilus assembly protein PilV
VKLMKVQPASSESGFTLVEVLVAGMILSTSLLALAYCFAQGMATVMASQQDTIARQKAREAMEDVLTARTSQSITWAQIENVSNGGIFTDGPTKLTTPGADGLVNTSDDGSVETIILPGPDGLLSDGTTTPLNGYTRQIQITDINANLKEITVTVSYTTMPGMTRSFSLETYVSPYI